MQKFWQFVRFCIIGTCAAAVHYGIYFLLQWMNCPLNIAYTAGYLISFVGNFYATNYFTFRTVPSWQKLIGFGGSHLVNYLLHIVLFDLFLWVGVHHLVAPPLVMLCVLPIQFLILRFVFVKKEKA